MSVSISHGGDKYIVPLATPNAHFWMDVMTKVAGTNVGLMRMLAQMTADEVYAMQDRAFRVEVNPDGTFNIVDFTLPSSSGRLRQNIPLEDVPKWVIESMAMLQIAEEGSYVKGVGFRVSNCIFYVAEKWEEKC